MLYGIFIIMIAVAFSLGRCFGYREGLNAIDDFLRQREDKDAAFKEETYKTIDAFRKEIEQLRKGGE